MMEKQLETTAAAYKAHVAWEEAIRPCEVRRADIQTSLDSGTWRWATQTYNQSLCSSFLGAFVGDMHELSGQRRSILTFAMQCPRPRPQVSGQNGSGDPDHMGPGCQVEPPRIQDRGVRKGEGRRGGCG